MLYASIADFVGNVNTVALSPIVSEPADETTLSRVFEWQALHSSLISIAKGLQE